MILCFGLLRPYKGVDVLLEAFATCRGRSCGSSATRAWTSRRCGELAQRRAGTVRFVARFVDDPEIPAIFRRADLVVLPYRDAEQSGVLYTALAFGKPIVASAVGGFPEVGRRTAPLGWSPPATRRRSPRRSASCSATTRRASASSPAAARRRGRPLLLGLDRRRDPRLYRELAPAG